MENINEVIIRGTIISYPDFFSITEEDEYYKLDVEVKRLSGKSDIISVVMPRKSIDPYSDYRGMRVNLKGEIQTKINEEGYLIMYVYTELAEIYVLYDENKTDILQ